MSCRRWSSKCPVCLRSEALDPLVELLSPTALSYCPSRGLRGRWSAGVKPVNPSNVDCSTGRTILLHSLVCWDEVGLVVAGLDFSCICGWCWAVFSSLGRCLVWWCLSGGFNFGCLPSHQSPVQWLLTTTGLQRGLMVWMVNVLGVWRVVSGLTLGRDQAR